MLGHTRDIETDYRRVMHMKREIPFSSCPSSVNDMVYASGATLEYRNSDEALAFRTMVEKLDDIAELYEQPKPRMPKKETRLHKVMRLGIRDGVWCIVDTDGIFEYNGRRYRICDQMAQYQPVKTEYGDLYDMDRVLVSGGKFYDMNLDEISTVMISGE